MVMVLSAVMNVYDKAVDYADVGALRMFKYPISDNKMSVVCGWLMHSAFSCRVTGANTTTFVLWWNVAYTHL